jgi:hypothetical protein
MPFVGGDATHAIQEAALDLKEYASGANDTIAIRVCSKEPMPVALSTATASPFIILEYLEHYGFSRDRILFLRSEECLMTNPSVALTEFWALPQGAAPPPSVETIRSSGVRFEVVRTGDTIKNARSYHAALKVFVAKLCAKSDVAGVVVGSYYKHPSRTLEKNLLVAKMMLERSGVPADQFYIRTSPNSGVHEHNESEPNYPNLFIIEMARDSPLK